jgi:hypothetical protein
MTFYSFPDNALPHSQNRHVPYHPRLKWGLTWSLSVATAYSVWVIGVALLEGRTYFPQYRVSIWAIIAAYYVASLICGLALGFLYFLANRRWTAALLGLILGFLSYTVCGIAMFGFRTLPILVAVIPGLVIGGGVGLTIFDDEHKCDSPGGPVMPRDQRPLLVVGVLGFALFFAATQMLLPDYVLYSLAALCVGAPIGVWLFLRRSGRPPTHSSPHAT